MRRAVIALVTAAGALAVPGHAAAHATLEATSPQRGAVVERTPAQVVLRFDEPVEGRFGAVRVFDAHGARTDEGDTFHPRGDGRRVAVRLRRGLADGTYTATYRVVSADSHVVSGGIVFSVGRATAAGKTVDELLGQTGAGPVTGVALGTARALQYAAIAIAGGALAFLLWIWLPALGRVAGGGAQWRRASEAFARRAVALLLGAAAVGAVSASAAVVLQGAQAAGVDAWSALRPSIVREVVDTRFGTTWTIGAAAWACFGAVVALTLAPRRATTTVLRPAALGATGLSLRRPAAVVQAAAVAPLVYLCVAPALSGHASTLSPAALLVPANALHVAAMALWVGGLVSLVVALPAATRQLPLPERAPLLAPVLTRFSAVALGAVAVLLGGGVAQALAEIDRVGALVDTAFGRAVLIKALLVAALVALGAVQRRRLVPAVSRAAREGGSPGAHGVSLARVLRAEIALVAAALAVTGALAGYPPPVAAEPGPFSATARVGGERLDLTVDPARVGANEVHLYLTDPGTGSPFAGADEVRVDARLPAKDIGAIGARVRRAGPGHYVAGGLALGVRGDWRVTVTVRVGAFDEHATTLEVPIR